MILWFRQQVLLVCPEASYSANVRRPASGCWAERVTREHRRFVDQARIELIGFDPLARNLGSAEIAWPVLPVGVT
jgi:hypothetical protein